MRHRSTEDVDKVSLQLVHSGKRRVSNTIVREYQINNIQLRKEQFISIILIILFDLNYSVFGSIFLYCYVGKRSFPATVWRKTLENFLNSSQINAVHEQNRSI
jgi:hypothetical protein